jgi:uncharacterized membrane protein
LTSAVGTGGWPHLADERQQTKDDKEAVEMARIEASVVINRPIEEVFAFVTDFENAPQWMSELVEGEQTSEAPVGVGTILRGVATPLGRRVESTQEVVEYEQNSKFAIKSTSGPVASEDRYTFESVDGSTQITRVAEAEMSGFFRAAEPLALRMMRRQFETNFANLRDLLEAQA